MLHFKINFDPSSDIEYLKTQHHETLSLVCHGNSALGKMAVDICILKKIIYLGNLTTAFVEW